MKMFRYLFGPQTSAVRLDIALPPERAFDDAGLPGVIAARPAGVKKPDYLQLRYVASKFAS
ncbi:hypothetical protein ACQJ22_27795, partial [Pseudomonas fragariae (ex Marin et al. 2024)]|uniref:hypothetical protein n=1 Tax=Pseudomonas fragariae (ex Marin et al. 2024) TaxID=3080056 RepID=UPI003D088F40